MKIDKGNLRHWIYLTAFAIQSLVGLILRLLQRPKSRKLIVLYGHKLNGNLLALYAYMRREAQEKLKPVFLTMDPVYCRELRRAGFNAQWAATPGCAGLLANAAAVISDHGLHSLGFLQPLYQRAGLRFVDVWHGIPFKGFDADDFRLQRNYDEIWVASDLHRRLYIERYGFDADRVFATGYARTDRLIRRCESETQLRKSLPVPTTGKLILFAPTWKQDSSGRSIYPFDHDESEFLGALSTLAARFGATVLLRPHLNSRLGSERSYESVRVLPSDTYPDAESILQISDMLICDWSSIAFDYLLMDRPTFFLEVPSPFRKGFSLGPEFRFGAIVETLPDLLQQIEDALQSPQNYWQRHGSRHQIIRSQLYGALADGSAADRCLRRLLALQDRSRFSARPRAPSRLSGRRK